MKALFTLPLFCTLAAFSGQAWSYATNATAYNSESSSIGISTSGPSGFGVGSEKGSDSSISPAGPSTRARI